MNWLEIKKDVLKAIPADAPKEWVKAVLYIERKLNSALNALNVHGASWQRAVEMCDPLYSKLEFVGNPEYQNYGEVSPNFIYWEQYCKNRGTGVSWNIGDALC